MWLRRLKEYLTEDAICDLTYNLDPRVIYWCGIHLLAHATSGKWGNEHPDSIRVFTALDRWRDKKW